MMSGMKVEKLLEHLELISYLAGVFPLTVWFVIEDKIVGGVSLLFNPRKKKKENNES